jgi:hypothetical protein
VTQATDIHSLAVMMGEMRGQLGELIKLQTEHGKKIDALIEQAAIHADLPAKIADLERRVKALEAASDRRAGAMGLGEMLLKSPAVGWAVGALTAVWAFITGHLKI